tara:strand:- start:41 stop:562 length:522 start_codon:yes stop_codon:yes gene_type:complete
MALDVTLNVGQEQKELPLGIRNNNPGNLRPYEGELYAGSSDIKDNFIVFDTAENGLRGLARDIQTKVNRKLNTIDSLTKVYAPEGENPTESYVNTVVSNMNSLGYNINKNTDITDLVKNDNFLKDYMKSKMKMELGAEYENYYSDEKILESIRDSKIDKKGPTKKELELKLRQ